MSIGSISGLAAAQSMFGVAAQAAGSVGSAGAGGSNGGASASAGNVAEQAGVAVPRMALDQERSLVNILA
jgi:hypothetical protein